MRLLPILLSFHSAFGFRPLLQDQGVKRARTEDDTAGVECLVLTYSFRTGSLTRMSGAPLESSDTRNPADPKSVLSEIPLSTPALWKLNGHKAYAALVRHNLVPVEAKLKVVSTMGERAQTEVVVAAQISDVSINPKHLNPMITSSSSRDTTEIQGSADIPSVLFEGGRITAAEALRITEEGHKVGINAALGEIYARILARAEEGQTKLEVSDNDMSRFANVNMPRDKLHREVATFLKRDGYTVQYIAYASATKIEWAYPTTVPAAVRIEVRMQNS